MKLNKLQENRIHKSITEGSSNRNGKFGTALMLNIHEDQHFGDLLDLIVDASKLDASNERREDDVIIATGDYSNLIVSGNYGYLYIYLEPSFEEDDFDVDKEYNDEYKKFVKEANDTVSNLSKDFGNLYTVTSGYTSGKYDGSKLYK